MSDLISSFLRASQMSRSLGDAENIPRKAGAIPAEYQLKGPAGVALPTTIDATCNEFENGKSIVIPDPKTFKTFSELVVSSSLDVAAQDLANGKAAPLWRLVDQHGDQFHECMGANIGKLWGAVEQAFQNGHGGLVRNLYISFGNERKEPDPEKRLHLEHLVSKGDCSLIRQQAEQLGSKEFCRFVGKNFLSYCSAFSEATRRGHGSAVTQLISDMAHRSVRQEKKTNLNAAEQLNTLEYQKIMTAEATECIKKELKGRVITSE
ncbi:hypothetical protein [Variovorax saccharolyticus]|uniref:hypothetical protein n=1 Tax=Variovorax saccharolyticus TaxID=3053516 RepID=UPI002577BC52|nr:hypothetical protein [Variovorax sp. J31P216]MDM0029900.1 hypothetical protein [Variovorax sp. J31P216]